jgi:hypothetical protein
MIVFVDLPQGAEEFLKVVVGSMAFLDGCV